MSYRSIDQLTQDPTFNGRNRSAAVQQAETYKDDARPTFVALSQRCFVGDANVLNAFTRLAAAGPGIGDKVDTGGENIDQALVTDGDILALTQTNWPTLADTFFNDDGTPRMGGA